jgi:hypothetical protein
MCPNAVSVHPTCADEDAAVAKIGFVVIRAGIAAPDFDRDPLRTEMDKLIRQVAVHVSVIPVSQ